MIILTLGDPRSYHGHAHLKFNYPFLQTTCRLFSHA